MKKLLIASTALVATSGFAIADVTLNGATQMGVKYEEDRMVLDEKDELFLQYELQFNFVASGTTDGGLTFGASAEVESDSNRTADSAAAGYDPEIFISGGFGTLTVGDVDVATDGFGNTADPGYDGSGVDDIIDDLIDANLGDIVDEVTIGEDTFAIGGPDANIRYDGTFGGLSIAITTDSFDEDFSATIEYDAGAFFVGLGYSEVNEYQYGSGIGGDSVSVIAGGAFGGFDIAAVYVTHDNDADAEVDGYGVSIGYDLGAYDVTFAANHIDVDDGPSGTSYGIGVAYDLGGGATLAGGVGSVWGFDPETGEDDDKTVANFGISMSF